MKITSALSDKTASLTFFIIAIATMIISPAGFAGDSSMVRIRNIQKVPDFEFNDKDFSRTIKRQFGCTGEINFIDENRVVLDDVSFAIAPGISVSGFGEGDYVGLKFDKGRRVTGIQKLQRPDGKQTGRGR